jgi:hypothetical protein
MRVLPIAKALGQISPRDTSAVAVQNSFDKKAIIFSGDANRAISAR